MGKGGEEKGEKSLRGKTGEKMRADGVEGEKRREKRGERRKR